MTYPSSTRVLAVLPDLIDGMTGNFSASTVRQREWAVTAALDHYTEGAGLRAMTRVTFAELLSPAAVQDHIEAATAGKLRQRTPAPDSGKAESPRTVAARASALRWLSAHTTHALPPTADSRLDAIPLTKLMAQHTEQAVRTLSNQDSLTLRRAAAVLAIVTVTAATSEELTDLTVDDVTISNDGITITATPLDPLPRGWKCSSQDPFARASVHSWARSAITGWLTARKQLVDRLQGTKPESLFLTCAPNGQKIPPGMPLQTRGLVRAHQRAIHRLAEIAPDLDPPHRVSTARRLALAYWLSPTPGAAARPTPTHE